MSSGGDNFANIICLATFQFTFKNKKILNLIKIILFTGLLHKLKFNARTYKIGNVSIIQMKRFGMLAETENFT